MTTNYTDIQREFIQMSLPQELDERQSFFCEKDFVWFIEKGELDTFLTRSENNNFVSAPSHAFRINEGGFLFYLGHSNKNDDYALLAKSNVNSIIKKIPIADFKKIIASEKNIINGTTIINEWIHTLEECCTKLLPPTDTTIIEKEQEFSFIEESSFCSRDEIFWADNKNGCLRLFGKKTLSNEDEAEKYYLPISQKIWLSSEEKSSTVFVLTESFLEKNSDIFFESIDNFNELIFKILIQDDKIKKAAARDSLKKKKIDEKRFFAEAIGKLTTVFKEKEKADTAKFAHEKLFVAAVTVADKQKIKLKFPSNYSKKMSPEEKLSSLTHQSKVQKRKIILEHEWWKTDHGPILAFLKESSNPVALLQTKNFGYQLYDPADNSTKKITAEVAATIKDVGYVFYRPFPDAAITFKKLIKFGLRGSLRDFLIILFVGIAGGILATVTPIVTGELFNTVLPSANKSQLLQFSLALFASGFGIVAFQLTRSFALLRGQVKMENIIQAAVWDRLLRLPIAFLKKFSAGELVLRAFSFSSIQKTISAQLVENLISSVFMLFNFFLLFYYSTRLALYAVSFLVTVFVVMALISIIKIKLETKIIQLNNKITSMLTQFISGIAKIRLTGTENRFFYRWADEFSKMRKTVISSEFVGNILSVLNGIAPIISTIIIFSVVTYVFSYKEFMSTGTFLAFNAALGAFSSAFFALIQSAIETLKIFPMYKQSKPILETEPESSVTKADPGLLRGDIEVENLIFRYDPTSPMVLNKVTFNVDPGSFVAIVGASGSGKSTLLRLFLRFETADSGTILFDQKSINDLDVDLLRKQFGVVLQNDQLIPGSILHNIIGSTSSYTIDDAWKAAEMAGISNEIKAMPMQMFTNISEGGGGLSGGQCQRIMIARAIIHKPKILFFDEATSSLDNASQAIVSKSIESLNTTRVVIAHRLSTIINADKIIVLHNGKIIETGNYQDLMNKNGYFAKLAERQIA